MKQALTSQRFWFVGGMVLIAALSRLIPHYPNFTAVGAMALFGAAHLDNKWLSLVIPIAALYISDLVLNNVIFAEYFSEFTWQITPFVYLAFVLVIMLGWLLRDRVKVQNVVLASLGASVVFFLVSNASAWWVTPAYTKDLAGLMTAYAAGIPFFWNTLAGDLFFSGVLFGGYAWATRQFPALTAE